MTVLWLCGPPGVGKTTVGWGVYRQLVDSGHPVGFVDVDQLGMCYPESVADPGRHLMKARNLAQVIDAFRAAGAVGVVASGVLDAARGPLVRRPDQQITVCRLRAQPGELVTRYRGRGSPEKLLHRVVVEAEELDASNVGDFVVDTSGRAVAETVRLVRSRIGPWPGVVTTPAPERREPTAMAIGGRVRWLTGVTGVGKSTVGFAAYQRLLRAGTTAAFLDLDQIGFYATAAKDAHRLKAGNAGALWSTFREAGATDLIMVGPVENRAAVEVYVRALGAAAITLYRLHAGPEQLARRIELRGAGQGWPQPGDPLRGQSRDDLLRTAQDASAAAEGMEEVNLGDIRVDTDERTAEQAAQLIIP